MTEVGQAPPEPVREAIDLLVVGAPTHAFGLSRPATRASAVEQAGGQVVSTDGALREWLDGLPRDVARSVAAFDTHADQRVPGSAARAAEWKLRRLGCRVAVPAESCR